MGVTGISGMQIAALPTGLTGSKKTYKSDGDDISVTILKAGKKFVSATVEGDLEIEMNGEKVKVKGKITVDGRGNCTVVLEDGTVIKGEAARRIAQKALGKLLKDNPEDKDLKMLYGKVHVSDGGGGAKKIGGLST
jgi:hypothetical protein